MNMTITISYAILGAHTHFDMWTNGGKVNSGKMVMQSLEFLDFIEHLQNGGLQLNGPLPHGNMYYTVRLIEKEKSGGGEGLEPIYKDPSPDTPLS